MASNALDSFEGADEPANPPEPPDPAPWAMPPIPGETAFWEARPALMHVHDFARARKVSPWATLGVVLARVVAATPPNVTLPPIIGGRASLNLAVGLVGGSGDGKDIAVDVAEEAVEIDHQPLPFHRHRLGSGQGIAHGFAYRQPRRKDRESELVRLTDSCLFHMDEIDTIRGLSNQRGSSTLMPELRSALMGRALGHLFVDPEKRIEIEAHSYRLALIVGIQPTRASVLLDDADAGTPQRFLWFPTTDPDRPPDLPTEPAPMRWRQPENVKWETNLTVCESARAAVLENREMVLDGAGKELEGHRLLLREKIAAALDLLNGSLEVSEEAWALASVVMHVSDGVRQFCHDTIQRQRLVSARAQGKIEGERAAIVAETVGDRNVQRVIRAILRHLGRADGEWVQHNELRKKLSSPDRQYFDQAVDWLLADKRINRAQRERAVFYQTLMHVPDIDDLFV